MKRSKYSRSLHPVLLLPGDAGSMIMARNIERPPHFICSLFEKNWFLLWVNLYYFTPLTVGCLVNSLKLEYDPIKKITYSPKFCETRVDGFGTSDAVEYFSNTKVKETSYFYYIIEDLVNILGYERNKNIRGAPYDFRKAPNEMSSFMEDLKKLIEQMYKENNNTSVILMAHSMGNMYIIRLLNSMTQQWKDTYIKKFFSISPPYAGAVDAIKTALSGNNEHFSIFSSKELKEAQNTWPSTYYLMPAPGMWGPKNLVLTDQENYSVNSLTKMFIDSKIQFAEDHLKDIYNIAQTPKAPNVTVHCIYSDNVPTPECLDYRGVVFPDEMPLIIMGPGDGTVNLQSLQYCTRWKNDQKKTVTTNVIHNATHFGIISDQRLRDLVIDKIKSYK